MTTANPELKADHLRFIERIKQAGKNVISYQCPCCGEYIKTQAAPRGATWDTLSTCYECGGLHMKITAGATACGVPLAAA